MAAAFCALLTGGTRHAELADRRLRVEEISEPATANACQWAAGLSLGLLAGLYGCGLLGMMGLIEPAPGWQCVSRRTDKRPW
jgi:two-component system sensor histidine kinase AlgZ